LKPVKETCLVRPKQALKKKKRGVCDPGKIFDKKKKKGGKSKKQKGYLTHKPPHAMPDKGEAVHTKKTRRSRTPFLGETKT